MPHPPKCMTCEEKLGLTRFEVRKVVGEKSATYGTRCERCQQAIDVATETLKKRRVLPLKMAGIPA